MGLNLCYKVRSFHTGTDPKGNIKIVEDVGEKLLKEQNKILRNKT
jgi:hypothetical protein